MSRSSALLLSAFALFAVAHASPKTDAQPHAVVTVGSVGVVYVISTSGSGASVDVVFPEAAVRDVPRERLKKYTDHAPARLDREMTIFDESGPVATLPATTAGSLVFWCENDGGMQWRPSFRARTPKLARPIRPDMQIQGIGAFALVGAHVTNTAGALATSGDVRLLGDVDRDGSVDARIVVAPDEAGNCDGKPANNLTIELETRGGTDSMRCCGP